MDKDSKFTRDEEGYIAVRVVSGTEALPAADKDYMFARDTNGNIAVRVVGAGGDEHNMGYFATPAALAEAYPTAEAGDYAVVGSTDTIWIWDEDNSEWVDSDRKGQVTSVNNQTGDVSLDINDVAPTQTDKSGYVLGTDGFVAGWVKPEIVQRSAMPQASEDELGNVYQFVGITDANYTNGYFYKCVSDGQNPATYSWSQVDVQPAADPLPSQTGQSGKFLTTDGSTASWSDKPLVNNTTNNNSLSILGNNVAYGGTVVIGDGSQASSGDVVCIGNNAAANSNGSICIGKSASTNGSYFRSVAIGNSARTDGGQCIAIGNSARTYTAGSGKHSSIAIGPNAFIGDSNHTTVTCAMQFGNGTNLESGTVCFGLSSNDGSTWNNYKILDSDGTVPEARLADTTSATEGQVLQLDSNGNAIWGNVDSLPSQTGQSGKVLSTNGTVASWETPTTITFRTWGANE